MYYFNLGWLRHVKHLLYKAFARKKKQQEIKLLFMSFSMVINSCFYPNGMTISILTDSFRIYLLGKVSFF